MVLLFANEGESKGPSSTPSLPDDRLWSFRAALSLWPSGMPEGSREHCEDRHPGTAGDWLSLSSPPTYPFPSPPSLPASRMLTGSHSFGKLLLWPHSRPKAGDCLRPSDPQALRSGRSPSNLPFLQGRQLAVSLVIRSRETQHIFLTLLCPQPLPPPTMNWLIFCFELNFLNGTREDILYWQELKFTTKFSHHELKVTDEVA